MKLELIIGTDTAIRCETPQEAEELFELLISKGITWINGFPLLEHKWKSVDGGTCYNITKKGLQYSDYNFYKDMIKYEIISSYTFIKSNTSILSMKNRFK